MIFISHRGNTTGREPKNENTPDAIDKVLGMGISVEIDVRVREHQLYLGHDYPQCPLPGEYLSRTDIWFHCKDIESLKYFGQNHNYFFIDKDRCVITSRGFIWLSPVNRELVEDTICVMPEDPLWTFKKEDIVKFGGICSDNIYHYQQYVTNLRR